MPSDTPARLKWFAIHVDRFLEDPRMQYLTEPQKGQWALLLIKSFRNRGVIITKSEVVATQIGCKVKEAKELVAILLQTGLLIPIQDKIYEAFSPKLCAEYGKALSSYESSQKGGINRQADAERDRLGRLI